MAFDIDSPDPEPVNLTTLLSAAPARTRESATTWLRGTRGLMLAVLQNGIQAYLRGGEHARNEVDAWMRENASEWPFSFTVVCETLGLDPASVRATLKRRASDPKHRTMRARPNVRG